MDATGFIVRRRGSLDYDTAWREMREFTAARTPETPDELWLLEHPPVFTQGQAGRAEHLLAPGGIPVVAADRGGQVTYHGPGQLVAYVLFDLGRLGIGPRRLVEWLEEALVATIGDVGVTAYARTDAHGVYVRRDGTERKIASIGLRVRRGCSYHGIALNVDMDLEPFSRINPCGHAGMAMTDLAREAGRAVDAGDVATRFAMHLAALR